MAEPLLSVQNLTVSFQVEKSVVRAVEDVSFDIMPGEIVGLVGESGSGKSVTAMSTIRLIPQPPGRVEQGKVLFDGIDLLTTPIEKLRKIRGRDISIIFQEPMTALSPLHPVGKQLAEVVHIHEPGISAEAAMARAIDWLDKVGIPDPAERAKAYPFQFSGGMRQRVMIAMALILHPRLIIADEPTTALDVTLQAQIFDLILQMKAKDTSILFITHDMGVIWELADRVLVMKDGRLIESGEVEPLFANPQESYTRELLAAVPRLSDAPRAVEARSVEVEPILKVNDLRTWFPVKSGVFARTVDWVKAVDDVSIDVFPGECLGLVGESGSGKTTLGRSILGLETPQKGEIFFEGQEIRGLGYHAMRPLRRHLQMIFQDPYSSLNSRLTVLEILTEGLIEHGMLKGEKREVAAHWLEEVGLKADTMNRYPHEFSGGQRQRICVARAVALEPKFVVCDEAVSALDVTIQAQVIDLLMDLKDKLGLSYLFISHDLSVVKRICDRVVVMRHGKVVEAGKTIDLVERPASEYTKRLIEAVPIPGDPAKRARNRVS
ncbi:MAG TPA: dipeptide ABC transporter ATP-binding protein [Verrucomicrobiales bacterium]|jgi:ABC-type microcin C transport system duplicated ATPase subunit YejF|nr:dipeptide ABC transporter ATP-binding protein [Verrucomicrobiales bacterium]